MSTIPMSDYQGCTYHGQTVSIVVATAKLVILGTLTNADYCRGRGLGGNCFTIGSLGAHCFIDYDIAR